MNLTSALDDAHQIQVVGFDQGDASSHMIAMLGRGRDFRRFVTADIERELDLQTPGAKLISIECTAAPRFTTRALMEGGNQKPVITGLNVVFPLSLRVKTSDENLWSIDVEQNYEASKINFGNRQNLVQNFVVIRHELLSNPND